MKAKRILGLDHHGEVKLGSMNTDRCEDGTCHDYGLDGENKEVEGLDIRKAAFDCETERVPLMMRLDTYIDKHPTDLLKDLDLGDDVLQREVASFANGKLTIGNMINQVQARKSDASVASAKKYPLSIVADMAKYKKDSDMANYVQKQNTRWNILFAHNLLHPELANIQESSLVLSDYGAVSTNHFHPWMFTNTAFSGSKVYLLFDVDEADEKLTQRVHQLKNIDVKTGNGTGKRSNCYQDVLNPAISRKITFAEFMHLKHAYFAAIASNDLRDGKNWANYLLCTSRYAHEVYTVHTGSREIYTGLSGFAKPNNPTFLTNQSMLQLITNAAEANNNEVNIKANETLAAYRAFALSKRPKTEEAVASVLPTATIAVDGIQVEDFDEKDEPEAFYPIARVGKPLAKEETKVKQKGLDSDSESEEEEEEEEEEEDEEEDEEEEDDQDSEPKKSKKKKVQGRKKSKVKGKAKPKAKRGMS